MKLGRNVPSIVLIIQQLLSSIDTDNSDKKYLWSSEVYILINVCHFYQLKGVQILTQNH